MADIEPGAVARKEGRLADNGGRYEGTTLEDSGTGMGALS